MQSINREQFSYLLKTERVKPRLARELRFTPEVVTDWEALDLLAIGTRSGSEGLLLVQTDSIYMLPYSLATGLADKTTGRSKPITCDLCYTWQRGGNAGRITFTRAFDEHRFTYLSCGDLHCSLHIRDITPEAALSRSQLHEDITVEQRIARLHTKLNQIILTLQSRPVALP